MRKALAEAAWHTSQRAAFGATLADQPAMMNVLADLAVESEAATLVALRLASAVDHLNDPHEQALRRIGLALEKFWVCKRTPFMVAEALECLGGNGYVEESGMPLLFRESPLNSIWEGSGNVNALDVLRALSREPESLDAWITEVGSVRGEDARLDAVVDEVLTELADLSDVEVRARRIAGRMAVALQGTVLIKHGDPAVADAFCASRLAGDWGGTFGTLPRGLDLAGIVARATPHLEN
jgi:putative acyl-CoA dehydrogenase